MRKYYYKIMQYLGLGYSIATGVPVSASYLKWNLLTIQTRV